MSLSQLLAALADGEPRHVTELARVAGHAPASLNALWQQAPAHLRGLLRQRDGFWHLVRPLALLPTDYRHPRFQAAVLEETASTNDELLDLVRAGGDIHRRFVAAHHQRSGRGRQGRAWQSRMGECLTFSIGWTFARTQAELGALAPLAALACVRALASLGCPAAIKWPNDLVSGTDKLGGILIESVRRDGLTHAVIGIGINFVLPKEVANAASVQALAGKKITAAALADRLLDELDRALEGFAAEGFEPFQAAYEAVHRDQNREVCLLREGETVAQGRVLGIAADGALRLAPEQGGEMLLHSGEISLRRPEQLVQAAAPAKPQQCLLLDGGNSRLKWAWVRNGRIVHSGHAPYRDLSQLEREWQERGADIEKIVGSAVCGEDKRDAAARAVGLPVEWLASMPRALGITNHYRRPEEHGPDRWFNALGSRRFTDRACVIVSCGTAVTIDALTADNHYLGGSIMPGFYLMKEALCRKTDRLGRPDGQHYPFPTTTANAIATGMTDAVCGALMLMHARLAARSSGAVDVLITGGGAAKVAAALPAAFTLDKQVKIVDNLVIFGLLNWIENA